MKRLFALILALLMCLGLAACGDSSDDSDDPWNEWNVLSDEDLSEDVTVWQGDDGS